MMGSRVRCAPAKGKNAKGMGKGVAASTAVPVASGVMVGGSVGGKHCQYPHMTPCSLSWTPTYISHDRLLA